MDHADAHAQRRTGATNSWQSTEGETVAFPPRRLLVGWMLVGTVLFVLLAFYVHQHPVLAVDVAITRAIQTLKSPAMDLFMLLVAIPHFFPQVIVLNVLVVLILYVCRLKWEALTLALVGPWIGISGTLIRYGLDRPRPTADRVWVAQVIENGHFGFPSGHTLGGLAVFGFVAFLGWLLLKPSTGRTVLVASYVTYIALVGISRVYAGEHWASDVAGGYLIGSVYLAGMILFYRWGRDYVHPRLARWLPGLSNESPIP